MEWLFGLAALLILLGWLSMRRSASLYDQTDLPKGRLVYADRHSQNWQPNEKPLYSARYGLAGKPDYLIETPSGLIPVEVKSSAAPDVPYLGHLLQLAAYCLLVEDTTGNSPPHGLLKYADALYEVDFTRELRSELLTVMAAMRRDRLAETVPRSHQQPNKCRFCGVAYRCDEALGE